MSSQWLQTESNGGMLFILRIHICYCCTPRQVKQYLETWPTLSFNASQKNTTPFVLDIKIYNRPNRQWDNVQCFPAATCYFCQLLHPKGQSSRKQSCNKQSSNFFWKLMSCRLYIESSDSDTHTHPASHELSLCKSLFKIRYKAVCL